MEPTDSYSEEELERKLARIFSIFANAQEDMSEEYKRGEAIADTANDAGLLA